MKERQQNESVWEENGCVSKVRSNGLGDSNGSSGGKTYTPQLGEGNG